MSLALQKTIAPAVGRPARPSPLTTETRLNVDVVFTSVPATLTALKKAADVRQVVPYPLPLKSAPVLLDWNERRFKVIAEQSSVETSVHLYLCRDRLATLLTALRPHSLVVLGGPKRCGRLLKNF